jgi:hypothetical protein
LNFLPAGLAPSITLAGRVLKAERRGACNKRLRELGAKEPA